jgi:SRSO17 transposase
MDLLDYPAAQTLLRDAELSAAAVQLCLNQLTTFAQRYLPLFHRQEQRDHALTVLSGKLTSLQRKTIEPIATQAGLKRRPLQLFVGAGAWNDRAVLDELRRHVTAELADDEAVFVLDPSAFPKKGTASCGVARQWCGCLGKLDNCQAGVFLAYIAPRGKTLLDARLYLDEDWAADAQRRAATFVPPALTFAEKWRIGLDLLDQARATLAGDWVAGDDEFGRCTEFRGAIRQRRMRYVLDVPCNTLVRDLSERRPARRPGGRLRLPVFERVDQWAARQAAKRWRKVKVRDGAKGPLWVRVLWATVQTKDEDGTVGARERVTVIQSCEAKPQTWYTLSNAHQARRGQIVRVHGARHGVEELLQEGKGEVGLGHYEVRSWTGWHHHMTLSLLALWFLQTEKLRLGKKNPGGDGAAGAAPLHETAGGEQPQRPANRGGGEPSAAA